MRTAVAHTRSNILILYSSVSIVPYSVRMDRLVQLVRPIPGFVSSAFPFALPDHDADHPSSTQSMFPEKIVIDFDHPPSALKVLFTHSLARYAKS